MYCMRLFAAALTLALMIAAPAWAGPPLLCHPNDIGSARSLPWLVTESWNGADPTYDLSHLTQDTLALLGPQTPVIVRMETIRRAVIYATHRAGLAEDLEQALLARVRATRSQDPNALFDAGYLVETLRDAQRAYPSLPAQQVDGLALMREAQRLGGTGMDQAVAMVEGVMAAPHR
ncbi:MAG TPA: hypothetical protein VF741_07375 [Candidatus Aquilonibacter sp.]